MGEVKELKGKKVETEGVMTNKAQEKIPYEQLEQMANQMAQQLQQLRNNLGLQRFEYLFQVCINPDKFSAETVTKALEEVESSLFKDEVE